MEHESLPKNFLANFDVELQEFYHRVVLEETTLDVMWRAKAVQQALTEVVKAYKKETVSKCDSWICFDTMPKRCAYVLKHCTCFTSAVANYMMKFVYFGDNKNILFKILESGRMNICCLGGGPATDAVAVIKIMQGLYHSIWLGTGKKLAMHVIVVDINGDWHKTVTNVFECVKKTANVFDMSELTLTYKFVTADLTRPMNKEVKEILNSADMTTLVYFLSAVNGSKAQAKGLPMMQSIMQNMKKGAFLFFLDSAADYHYKMLNKAADKWPSMEEVYGPLVEELHTISLESVRKFVELHAKHFDTFFCMTNIFLCVSSWYKVKSEQPRAKISIQSSSWPTPSQEESDELTKKMLEYRANVRKLVQEEYSRNTAHSTYR